MEVNRMFYEINNLRENGFVCNYKGLDIDRIIAKSQVYNFDSDICILETQQSNVKHKDLIKISQEQYLAKKEEIETKINKNKPISAEEKIAELEKAVAELSVVLAGGVN
jgi:hypothetical protein